VAQASNLWSLPPSHTPSPPVKKRAIRRAALSNNIKLCGRIYVSYGMEVENNELEIFTRIFHYKIINR